MEQKAYALKYGVFHLETWEPGSASPAYHPPHFQVFISCCTVSVIKIKI